MEKPPTGATGGPKGRPPKSGRRGRGGKLTPPPVPVVSDSHKPKIKKQAIDLIAERFSNIVVGPRRTSSIHASSQPAPDIPDEDTPLDDENEGSPYHRTLPTLTYGEGPEVTPTTPVGILKKFFHGMTSEDMKDVSKRTWKTLIKDLACSSEVLGRAIFDMILLLQRSPEEGIEALSFALVESLKAFVDVLENSVTGFERFGEDLLQGFANCISQRKSDTETSDRTGDVVYKSLGQFFGMILDKYTKKDGKRSQNNAALDIIMYCMYWKPDRAFAFLHHLLLRHGEPFDYYQQVITRARKDVPFWIILYVVRRGEKDSPRNGQIVRNHINTSLRNTSAFQWTSHSNMLEDAMKMLKDLKEAKEIERGFKYLRMFFVYFDDWTYFTDYVNVHLEKALKEFDEEEKEIPVAVVVEFLRMIGAVVSDMKSVGDIAEFQGKVSAINPTNPDIVLAALTSIVKMDDRIEKQKAAA